MRSFLLLLIVVCSPLFILQSKAQTLQELPLINRQSILNDKAFLLFPAAAANMERGTDIMSVGPNADRETRIVLDKGKQRLVFYATQLMATGDGNFAATVARNNKEHIHTRVLADKDSLLSVLATLDRFDSTEGAILINRLYVRAQDCSVFIVDAYINPEAMAERKAYQALSEKVFATLSKGSRRLDRSARTEAIPVYGGKKLQLALPEGYAVTKDSRGDFEVIRVEQVKDMADTTWSSLTIYLGNYPSYFYSDYGFKESDATAIEGRFLDKAVRWMSFKDPAQGRYLKEQHIPAGDIDEGLIIHIAMSGSDQAAIDSLTKLVERIRMAD